MGLNVLFEGSNFERLLGGLWVTAKIAFVSVFFACILGILLGLLMTSKNRLIRAVCRFYLEFVPTQTEYKSLLMPQRKSTQTSQNR